MSVSKIYFKIDFISKPRCFSVFSFASFYLHGTVSPNDRELEWQEYGD
jgi:hypothetical protein